MSIQSSINSMIGTAGRASALIQGIRALKGKNTMQNDASTTSVTAGSSPQEQAAQVARQSADNEIKAKAEQKKQFRDYIKSQPTSLGGTVGDLPLAMQKQIASQYTKSQRRTIMNRESK